MTWIMIGVIGGSLVVSGHDSKEACEGRAAVLREQKVPTKCTEAPGGMILYSTSPSIWTSPSGTAPTR